MNVSTTHAQKVSSLLTFKQLAVSLYIWLMNSEMYKQLGVDQAGQHTPLASMLNAESIGLKSSLIALVDVLMSATTCTKIKVIVSTAPMD